MRSLLLSRQLLTSSLLHSRCAPRGVLRRALLVAATIAIAVVPRAQADTSGALTLEVTGTPDPARVGDRINFNLLFCNNGDADATGAKITQLVPTGVSFPVATDGATCTTGGCGGGATLSWNNLGTLLAHRCRSVGVSFAVNAGVADGTDIVFTFDLDVDGGGTVSDSLTITVDSTSALVVEMTDDADPVSGGDVIWYTVAFGNRSTGNVLNGLLTAPVPAGTTVLSIEDGGSEAGGNITWPLGTISAGANGRRRFSVTVDEPAVDGSAILAEAEVTGTGESARATLSTAIVSTETLSMHVSAHPDAIAPGARVLYDLTICNSADLEATGVFVDMLVPNGESFAVSVGATCSTGGCGAGALLQWNVDTLGAGRCQTLPLSFAANAGSDGGLIRNALRLRADGGAFSWGDRTVAVDSAQELALALSEDRDPVAAGETITYTVTYGVTSASANTLANVLRAWVPKGTAVASIGGGGTEADGVITWNLGTLRAGESGQRQFTVTVDAGALDGTAIDATAEIDRDTTSFGALASQTTTVNGEGTLTLRLAAQPDPSRSGERIVYDLVLCNPGIDEVTGLDLDILMPNGLAFVVATDGATCSTGGCGAGGLVNWDLGTLGAHRCRTLQTSIRDQFTVDAALIILEARLRADNRQTAMAQRTVMNDSTPSLALAVTEDRDPVAPGDTLTYTVAAANRNDSENVTGTTLRFAIPADTTLVSASDGGTEADGFLTWDLATMAAGDTIQRTVVVTVDAGIADGSSVTAEAELTGGSTEKFGARASQVTSVVSTEPLTLDLTATPDPVRPGDTISYDIVVCNHGLLEATGVALDLFVPNYLAFARASEASPACSTGGCGAGSLITFTVGQLAEGRCRTLSMTELAVAGTANGDLIISTGRVLADGGSVATASRATAFDSDQVVTSFVSEATDPAPPGEDKTFNVSFGNRGSGTFSNGEVRVTIPPGVTVKSASGGAVVEGNEVSWGVCPMSAGQSATYSYTVTLDDGATLPNGTALLTDLDFGALDGNPPASHSQASTGVVANAPLALTLIATPGDVAKPNDLVTYDLEACNNGVDQATGVSLLMFVPRGMAVSSIDDGGTTNTAGEIVWSVDAINASECATVNAILRVNQGSYVGDGTVIPASARMIVDGGETATASKAIRTCATTAGACTVKPPPPCGAPQSRACNRTASDALAILRAAVKITTCPLCECDVDSSGAITASDALTTLKFSVGQAVTLRCPACL